MINSLEELIKKRLELIEVHKKNDFTAGLRAVLTSFYPDIAHFVYELLQNAEDMDATVVRFSLSKEGVGFEHNGTKRDFNIADIDAITSIGNNAQKKDDPTSIGKFGVGFKAVFAYTNTPEIHSGKYHFKIKDYFVPDFQDVYPVETIDSNGVNWTKFYFPFDNPDKPAELAQKEILNNLQNLNDLSVLFLKNIKRIEYILPNATKGYIECIENKEHFLTITCKRDNERVNQVSKWLRFKRQVDIIDDQHNPKQIMIAIAYFVAVDSKTNSDKLIPVIGTGKTCIYFPAEKEHSGLRFHINALFASTVARDSIRDCPENTKLMREVAKLVADSIGEIKRLGLLNISYLSILPSQRDRLPFLYQYIADHINNAFHRFEYLPTKNHGFVTVSNALIGSAEISNLFNDEAISELLGAKKQWVINAPQKNSYEDNFIRSLGIKEFSHKSFIELFSDEIRPKLEAFVQNQSDEWLKRFYLFCASQEDDLTEDALINIKQSRIIRSSNGVMCKADEILLLPVGQKLFAKSTPIIKQDLLIDNTKNIYKENKIREFFSLTLGIKKYGPKLEAEKLLKKIEDPNLADEEHILAMLKLAKYNTRSEKDPTYEKIDFSKRKIFRCKKSKTEGKRLAAASNIVLAPPYAPEVWNRIASIYGKGHLWGGYKQYYTESQLQEFLRFAQKCGIIDQLKIKEQPAYYHPEYSQKLYFDSKISDYLRSKDYTIEKLPQLLELKSYDVSRLIWDLLEKSGKDFSCPQAFATFSPNKSAKTRSCDSSLIHYLKLYPWIPKKNKKLWKPAEIMPEEIKPSFSYDENNKLFKALKIGETAILTSEKVDRVKREAASINMILIPKDEKDLYDQFKLEQEQKKLSPIEALLESQTKKQQSSVQEEQKRTAAVGAVDSVPRATQNIQRTFLDTKGMSVQEIAMFSVIVTSSQEEREKLEHWYFGKCQMCNTIITRYDNKPHFIARNIINTRDINATWKKSIKLGWNSICLCPNCAAKYANCSKDITSLYRQILSQQVIEGSPERIILTIELDNKVQRIQYAPEHFLAMQQVFILLDKEGTISTL